MAEKSRFVDRRLLAAAVILNVLVTASALPLGPRELVTQLLFGILLFVAVLAAGRWVWRKGRRGVAALSR